MAAYLTTLKTIDLYGKPKPIITETSKRISLNATKIDLLCAAYNTKPSVKVLTGNSIQRQRGVVSC